MKLSQFKLNLPDNLIAEYPIFNRDESRLMVVNRNSGEIQHSDFRRVIDHFDDKDLFIFNDTRVFPAKLIGNKEKTGARIDVFLLRELNPELRLWDVLVDPARKIRIGNKLYFGEDDSLIAEVIDNTTSRGRTLRFLFDGEPEEFRKTLYSLGQTPIPAYINREADEQDAERYQTIYAKHEGAVVAPAAGLHFSRELLKRLEIKGVDLGYLTVHSGLGCYRDIDVEDLTKHKMDSEQLMIPEDLVAQVESAQNNNLRVCAVGTSVLRALETAATTRGNIKSFEGWTNRFIFPPYEFQVATSLITNFHLSQSTLLMMTAAFGGYDLIMDAYNLAIKEEYRFGAYGDAMLII